MPAVTINDSKHCEAKVDHRAKFYDKPEKGLFVSVTTGREASFGFKFTNPKTGQREILQLGKYVAGLYGVDQARDRVADLKKALRRGEDISQQARQQKQLNRNLSAKTVAEVIDEYVAWMKEPVVKKDGEERPRKESWATTVQYLEGYAKPHLGIMIASEVESDDIARLQEGLRTGKLCKRGKGSLCNARLTRAALSAMFKWAAQSPRRYVNGSPCINLPELDKSPPRTRKLTMAEIRAFWTGLDRADLPCHRATALALKLQLATMMRSGEFRTAVKDEIEQHEDGTIAMHVPLKRVKRRRKLQVPLNGMALDVLQEAAKLWPKSAYLFTADGKTPLAKTTMSQALRGVTYQGKVKQLGICEWLGIEPFTPHVLRRTAAHFAQVTAKQPMDLIKLCLDHREGSQVTEDHYVQSQQLAEKLQVLTAWDAVLRDIIAGKITDRAKVMPFKLAA